MRHFRKKLRKVILEAGPDSDEVIKWNMPVYEKNGKVCSIAVHKNHINLHFFRGIELTDPEHLLQGTGKAMRHVKIRTLEDIKTDSIAALVREAAKLNIS